MQIAHRSSRSSSAASVLAALVVVCVATAAIATGVTSVSDAVRPAQARHALEAVAQASPRIGSPERLPRVLPGELVGRLLATDGRCRLREFDLATLTEVPLAHAGAVVGCRFWTSARGRFIAFAPARAPFAAPPGTILDVADLTTGAVRHAVGALPASGSLVVTARGRIRAEGAATAWQASSRLGGAVWRLASADRARSIDRIGPSLLVGVTFAPDGVVAAVTTGDAIAFVDTATLAPFARLDTPFVTIRWIR